MLALVALVSIDPRGADPALGLTYSSTHILLLVMINMWAPPLTRRRFIYCLFYLTMKLLCGERPTPCAW